MMWTSRSVTKMKMIQNINKRDDEDELSRSRDIKQSPAPLDGNEIRSSPLEINQEQIQANDEKSVGQQADNQVKALYPTPRSSTRT